MAAFDGNDDINRTNTREFGQALKALGRDGIGCADVMRAFEKAVQEGLR